MAAIVTRVYQRIIVGTDGSRTAAIAVARAVEVAKATGATLTILSVGNEKRARAVAETEAAKHADAGVEIIPEGLSGDAATVLTERADNGGFDLLVVGNKGMTGPSRFLVGSVPNKVSHHAPCALLIVRTT